MGDAVVQCDSCGAFARRRPAHPCPDHWFYQSEDRTPGCPKSVYIVWACSAECRDKLWQRGPGGNSLEGATRPNRKAKPGRGGIGGRRIAELEAALREALDSWEETAAERNAGHDASKDSRRAEAAEIARLRTVLAGREATGG